MSVGWPAPTIDCTFLILSVALTLTVVAAVAIAALINVWWVGVIAAAVLILLTVATVLLVLHYVSGAGYWLGPSEEAELQSAGLVEAETGLPKRRRWNERRAAKYAEAVARRGLAAVPDGWRGPEGAHQVLVLTTMPISPQQLRSALPATIAREQLAVLVIVPTLAETAVRVRLGDASEAVEHAEQVTQKTVASLRNDGIQVTGHIGPADPAVALSDGLRTYDAELVVVARNYGANARYLEDVPLQRAAEVFNVPIKESAINGSEPLPSKPAA